MIASPAAAPQFFFEREAPNFQVLLTAPQSLHTGEEEGQTNQIFTQSISVVLLKASEEGQLALQIRAGAPHRAGLGRR